MAVVVAMLFCGCSGSETDDNPQPQPQPNPTESSNTLVRIILSENDLTFNATGGEQTVLVKFEYVDSQGNGTMTDRWQLTGGKS